ncbi:MAG: hypothetical protein SPF89_07380 [Sphaerochaetaceae bacterium]|nr:hypothetical protein [Spirochaetales bacterium]MDY5499907.1 hypothetical protein [Sphaerochaetaceae bacterium]
MKKTYSLGIATLLLVALLASCATTASPEAEQIPAAPAAVPAAPVETPKAGPAPVAAAPASAKEAPASAAPVVETPAPVAEAPAAPTLAERIDAANASNITVDEALDIAYQLTNPANDPDGTLTAKALAKADEIVTSLIDGAMSEEEINAYIDLMNEGMDAYGDYVKALGINVQPYFDMVQERKVAIEAYNKNSYYYYLKQYRKDGRYKKELSELLTKKNAKKN